MARLRRTRRIRTVATLSVVTLGPVLAVATYLIIGPFGQGASSSALRLILLADLVYVLIVAAMVLGRIGQMVAARRAKSAGSQLHLRLTGVFALIALIPTVLVAVFAGLTINMGLEGWFSDRVRNVVGASLAGAEAYHTEQSAALTEDAETLGRFISGARRGRLSVSDGEIRQVLSTGQAQIQRGLREAFVIDGSGEIRARGDRSYLFDYEQPTDAQLQIAIAAAPDPVLIEDWDANEYRALVALAGFADRFLYVTRDVDGALLALLDETKATARFYNQLESERGQRLFQFGLIYIGFAVILILAAVWLGLWFAERLSLPIGRLAGAAQRVGSGDLSVRVKEEEGEDEIATLGQVFNQMTVQLKAQRDTLLEANAESERQRRLFDSVLSSVTAGVIGLTPEGRVDFMNRAAVKLLDLEDETDVHEALGQTVPEFAGLLARLRSSPRSVAQEEIKLTRRGTMETLLVRMAERRSEDGHLEGYVVAFDDVSELVSAQRMAAWGDVARRIAHEIKNPLTPIQLSAERAKRKFTPKLNAEDAESLAAMTDVIVRQTGDLRRIVDEFSKFARMPEPEREELDLVEVTTDAVRLQREALGDALTDDLPVEPIYVDADRTMISQSLTNLIKNAGEAIESLQEDGVPDGHEPRVHVRLVVDGEDAELRISDNGIGLPADRARLFEPYVTTREKGTGLGLPIVKKIIEEHGGSLELVDAEPMGGTDRPGAEAVIRLPRKIAVQAAAE